MWKRGEEGGGVEWLPMVARVGSFEVEDGVLFAFVPRQNQNFQIEVKRTKKLGRWGVLR